MENSILAQDQDQATQISKSPPTRDDKTAALVEKCNKETGFLIIGVIGVALLWVLIEIIRFGFTGWTVILNPILTFFAAKLLFWLINLFTLLPVHTFRLTKREGEITNQLIPSLGLIPTKMAYWQDSGPNCLVVDLNNRVVFLDLAKLSYNFLFLNPHQILGAKVEREIKHETTTKESGRTSVFSTGVGLGYTFGGKTKSTTKSTETAFLELHYRLNESDAPRWVVIPFGSNRQEAESIMLTINQLRG